MPFWLLRKARKHVPWKMVWAGAAWTAAKGRDLVERNLTQAEQTEFWNLLKKSKGRPGNLAQRDRTRLKHIVTKAIRG